MTAPTIAEQIAAMRQIVERADEQDGRWPNITPVMRAVLATLGAQPAMLVAIEAARKLVWWKIGDKPQAQRWAELQHALAALPTAPETQREKADPNWDAAEDARRFDQNLEAQLDQFDKAFPSARPRRRRGEWLNRHRNN